MVTQCLCQKKPKLDDYSKKKKCWPQMTQMSTDIKALNFEMAELA